MFGKEFAPLRPRGLVCEATAGLIPRALRDVMIYLGKKLITGFLFDRLVLVLGKGPGSQVVPDPAGHRRGLHLLRLVR